MIKYNSGSFGFSVLLRIHGSAVYKSLLPSLISSVIFIALFETIELRDSENKSILFGHPYPMGALISALTFLLSFRANFAYNRYWEGIGSVFQMHSKWLDVGMELAAFHLQAAVYDGRKPPAFGAHPELNDLERARERKHQLTLEELESQLETMEQHDEMEEVMGSSTSKRPSFFRRRRKKQEAPPEPKKIEESQNVKKKVGKSKQSVAISQASPPRKPPKRVAITKSINAVSLPPIPRHHKSSKKSSIQQFANWITSKPSPTEREIILENAVVQAAADCRVKAWDHDKPSLFLQEAAHLLSLLSAVAFSTLRNDLEQADSPLIPFTANAPWPHVDPDSYEADVRKDWATSHYTITVLRYIFGWSRTPTARTLYNAARPFRVIGGVSDAEIELLQAARGPFAKVALCTLWLQEFIIRESLAGATGKVAPPILSRLFQFVSDGMIGYNQARKVAYIPFPFPHAQITSLFVLVVVGFMPVLILSYLTNETFGFVLNFLCVMSFTGLHEVARELENPFQNVPNDVPLNNFQAQYNESLLQMFTGYHPDAHWEVVQKIEKAEEVPSSAAPSVKDDDGDGLSTHYEADEPQSGEIATNDSGDDMGDVELGEKRD